MIRTLRPNARPAFFTADVMIAMGIVAVLAVSVFVILNRAGRMASGMSDSRTAARAAEGALADLQAGRPLTTPAGLTISVHAEPGGDAVSGYAWVRVSADAAGKSAELVGQVPDDPRLREIIGARTPTTREGQ